MPRVIFLKSILVFELGLAVPNQGEMNPALDMKV